jgi:CheY-like chemotaxis protein
MSVRATESIEILLVDDDEDDVLMMREALRAAKSSARLRVLSEGSQVTPYLRGEGDHAGANRPDLILLDLNLPGRDGRQVLADIKGGRRGANRRRCDRRGGGSPGRGRPGERVEEIQRAPRTGRRAAPRRAESV